MRAHIRLQMESHMQLKTDKETILRLEAESAARLKIQRESLLKLQTESSSRSQAESIARKEREAKSSAQLQAASAQMEPQSGTEYGAKVWTVYQIQRQRLVGVARQVILRWKNRYLSCAFQSMVAFVKGHLLARQVVARMQRLKVARSFSAWRSYKHVSLVIKRELRRALGKLRIRVLATALS
eukprot:SAG11_NODE_15819_length_565_cov_1.268240_1_plen_182_part_10